jgi:hypothetical protein
VETYAAALQAARPSGLHIAVYRNGWHMLLRDLEGETVWRDIAAWIADPAIAALPSGAGRDRLPLFASDAALRHRD